MARRNAQPLDNNYLKEAGIEELIKRINNLNVVKVKTENYSKVIVRPDLDFDFTTIVYYHPKDSSFETQEIDREGEPMGFSFY